MRISTSTHTDQRGNLLGTEMNNEKENWFFFNFI